MASRRFTIDPAKKKKFLNFILQMPKLHVPDAMKLAMFSNKDITDLGLRRFLQRALLGGTVKAMKMHLGAFHPPEPPPPTAFCCLGLWIVQRVAGVAMGPPLR
jgi:hypothetical protein